MGGWQTAPDWGWAMLERRPSAVDAAGQPVNALYRATRPQHWLLIRRGQVSEPTQQQPPESVTTYAWHATPLDQSGGGTLRWKQFGPRAHEALERVDDARKRRLTEAFYALDPSGPSPPPLPLQRGGRRLWSW